MVQGPVVQRFAVWIQSAWERGGHSGNPQEGTGTSKSWQALETVIQDEAKEHRGDLKRYLG